MIPSILCHVTRLCSICWRDSGENRRNVSRCWANAGSNFEDTARSKCLVRLPLNPPLDLMNDGKSILGICAEAGKFLAVRRIFARIFPNFPENFWATFCANTFSWWPFLGWPPTKGLHVILHVLGAISSNQSTLGAIFARIFRDLTRIFTKSKLLGGPFNSASYTTDLSVKSPFTCFSQKSTLQSSFNFRSNS